MASSSRDFYRDWNIFSSAILGLSSTFYKNLLDYGIQVNFSVHNNVPDSALGLGDIGLAGINYTPQEIYPCTVLHDKVVLSTPDGVWIGKNKEAAEMLSTRDYVTEKIEPENVIITSKLIESGKSPSFVWEYLTGEPLFDNRLSKPYDGKKLGLRKTDYVGAAYFLWGKRDPRRGGGEAARPKGFFKNIVSILGETHVPFGYNSMDWMINAVEDGINRNSPERSIKMITDLDEFLDMETLLPVFYALQNGFKVEVITGPDLYIKKNNLKEMYPKPIELSDGFVIEPFSSDALRISNEKKLEPCKEAKKAGSKETAMILTALAEKNKRPILYSIAANACIESMKKEGIDYELMSLLSYNAYKDGMFNFAANYSKEALKLAKPEEKAEVMSNLGFFYSKTGDYPESIQILREGIQLKNDQKYIHNNLATTHHILAAMNGKERNFREAECHYEKEIENTPDHPYAESMLRNLKLLEKLSL